MTTFLNRRTVLRGMIGGAAVTVGLPILDCFLNTNGTAFASGAPLPVRFGTWFWGLGVTPSRWVPSQVGPGYDLMAELQPMAAHKEKVSIMSGFNVRLDGRPAMTHYSGPTTIRTGLAPATAGEIPGPSFDIMVSDAIGSATRFRALDLSAIKGAFTLSGRGTGNMSPSESSAYNLYTRLFGPEFRDPNKAEFAVNPRILARHSVLSSITDDRKSLDAYVGSADRVRLDQYYTSLRQVEKQLALQLEPPPPMAACKIPVEPPDLPAANNVEEVHVNHDLMAKLLAMALMCDQTRVFNLSFNDQQSTLTRIGNTTSHHQLTHEETIDPKLGYQPQATKFVEDCMQGWASFLEIMDGAREGDGTLLDNMLVVAHTDVNYAKFHTLDSIPVMLAGRAGGRVRSGVHVAGKGDSVSRVVLTAMQAVGVPVDRWGKESSETNRPVSEILA